MLKSTLELVIYFGQVLSVILDIQTDCNLSSSNFS